MAKKKQPIDQLIDLPIKNSTKKEKRQVGELPHSDDINRLMIVRKVLVNQNIQLEKIAMRRNFTIKEIEELKEELYTAIRNGYDQILGINKVEGD